MIDRTTHKDEATVIIAIRGRKAPCPASTFDGQRQEDSMLAGDLIKRLIDNGDFFAIHIGRNASQAHPTLPKMRDIVILWRLEAVHMMPYLNGYHVEERKN